ncbi:Outer membrane protein beta-barrel domain-containing protein [Draconibacterium orientale]|uniref:Outer membrane protein beta-barrel domain-containing protein n=2 Tax=Draconibacterium orientale TaxID=1168034 RepID=A0A1I0AKQ0_9BACT|nr:Outer membrane protein beta-barrel domain-containing protein [Draconibacterium orientale]
MNRSISIICLILFVSIVNFPTRVMALGKEIKNKTNQNEETTTKQPLIRNTIDPIWGFYTEASPGLIQIKNKGATSGVWESDANLAYTFSAGYFREIAPMLKIKAGFGLSGYKTTLTGSGEIVSQPLVDIDNDTYIETLKILSAEHTINPIYLNVPVSVEYGTVNISQLGYYIDIGFEYSYLISENNTTSGTYSTSGYYPQWGVKLENIPELGFYTDRALDTELTLKKNILSIRAGAGISLPISGVLIFKVGIAGYKGINSIGNGKNINNDNTISEPISKFRTNYAYNPLSTSKGNKPLRFGIEFGLYICKQVK